MLKYNINNKADRRFYIWTKLFAGSIILLFFGMIIIIAVNAWPSISRYGLDILWDTSWNPVTDEYGALPFIYGSVVSSLLALLLGVPLGIGSAIFLAEICPKWLRTLISFTVELLASIPSVVYGVWGIFVMVPLLSKHVQPFLSNYFGFIPFFEGPAYGFGMLAGGLILTIMILPIITSISRDVIMNVPAHLREASFALGATRWETLKHVILPSCKPGLIGAVMLGFGRAIGETMAVLMVIGNKSNISLSLFKPASTMASVIAGEFAEASAFIYKSVLIEIGFILFVITLLINIFAKLIIWKFTSKAGGEVNV